MSLFGCSNCNSCQKVNCLGSSCKDKDKIPATKIILVGNPNVGKSVIFNALSGFYVEISNYPGTTVDVSTAFTSLGEIIDTPGAYSLGNFTDDEIVTQKIVNSADVIINVVGALSLERDLFLTQQLIDMGFPLILVVNQLDEAEKNGIGIDCKKLEEKLGIKVIPTIAVKGRGISDIINAIKENRITVSNKKTPSVIELLQDKQPKSCEVYEYLLNTESQNSESPKIRETIFEDRHKLIKEIIADVIFEKEKKESLSETIGNLLLNPIIGTLVAITALYILFELLGVLVAGDIVNKLVSLMDHSYIPWITKTTEHFVPISILNQILIGEFGVLTMSVKIIFGVLFPLILAFYLFMSILEDSGYLPRLAVLADNVLNKIGLNGRAIIPILLGFGCGTMGTLTTRILGSKKERTIATAILSISIPCAAQQGIIISLLAAIGGVKVWFVYIAILFSLTILTGTVLDKIIPGKSSDLLIDLPPIRKPLLKNTINKTVFRVTNFLAEAIPMFTLTSIGISILNCFGFLNWLQKLLSPIVVNLLHLPAEFTNLFVMGLIRRDFAAVGLMDMAGISSGVKALTDLQILVASIVITLFVPCIAALMVIYKERGLKEATLIWISTFIISIGVGTIVSSTMGFLF